MHLVTATRAELQMASGLWTGVEFKLDEAAFFMDEMGKALVPPRNRRENQLDRLLSGSVHGTTGVMVYGQHPW